MKPDNDENKTTNIVIYDSDLTEGISGEMAKKMNLQGKDGIGTVERTSKSDA